MLSLIETRAMLTSGAPHAAQTLVDRCLDRAADPQGQGGTVFTTRFEHAARAQAQSVDALAKAGVALPPLAGVPISIKDLLDVAGLPTPSGSRALADAPPAADDAVALQRLRAAGAVIVGRTNMSELAFTGVGINPHFGTPLNPWDRATGRVPGGSSSGAAVSVTDGMAVAAIGSDTGGSVRIPAALCGLAGFKPTQRRVSLTGARPLSTTLDSLGPLAPTVACCALLDAVLAGERPTLPVAQALRGVRLAVPQSVVFDDSDAPVVAAFQATLSRLSEAGAVLTDIPFATLTALLDLTAKVGFSAVECYAIHRDVIDRRSAMLDPRVYARLRAGKTALAADYVDLIRGRERLIAEAEALLAGFDAWVMPTVPLLAPPLAVLTDDDEAFRRANALLLRNTMLVNLLDGCALTIPCHQPGTAPLGFSLAGPAGRDARILGLGLSVEALLRGDHA
jgi:aspartyl-tRNA(Asn)/glutamyl-tRNA(Gln) amidotransferase subunit A